MSAHLAADTDRVSFAGATLELDSGTFRWDGVTYFTKSHTVVLGALMERGGRVATRGAVFDSLYGDDLEGGPEVGEKILDTFICLIRRTLRAMGAPFHIVTDQNRGWHLEAGRAETAYPVRSRFPLRFVTYAEVRRAGL